MKRIRFRIDDWLKERLEAFDLSAYECIRRAVKKIKKGKLILEPVECGKLTNIITVDLPDDMSDVKPCDIRTALMMIFKNIVPVNPIIEPDDLKYKPFLNCNQPQT